MQEFIQSPLIMTALGLLFGLILAVAYRFLKVEEDPRIEAVEALLPGTNCGACGEAGCLGFAEKVTIGEKKPSGCTVGTVTMIENIAEFLNVDTGDEVKRVARLHCAGGKAQAHQIAEYHGFESCHAAAVASGGGKGCSWGCLGLGDCEKACTFNVIHMNSNALPVVNVADCTACSDCVDVCPRNLFEIVPIDQPLFVQCSLPLEGENARMLCKVACDGCKKCVKDAEAGLIHMENNLPVIDYASGLTPTKEATYRCPTHAIRWLHTEQQFAD
jgi:RnfABCDGE-type electron transport complex B subunit